MSNLEDEIFDDYPHPDYATWDRLWKEYKAIKDSGYPDPHYDEEDCCPCPDHVAMRWYRED